MSCLRWRNRRKPGLIQLITKIKRGSPLMPSDYLLGLAVGWGLDFRHGVWGVSKAQPALTMSVTARMGRESTPGIDQLDATIDKVLDVASGENSAPRAGGGSDHRIKLADGLTEGSSRPGNVSESLCAIPVKGNHPTSHVLIENRFHRRAQAVLSRSVRQNANAIENLGLYNRRSKQR